MVLASCTGYKDADLVPVFQGLNPHCLIARLLTKFSLYYILYYIIIIVLLKVLYVIMAILHNNYSIAKGFICNYGNGF